MAGCQTEHRVEIQTTDRQKHTQRDGNRQTDTHTDIQRDVISPNPSVFLQVPCPEPGDLPEAWTFPAPFKPQGIVSTASKI